MGTVTKLPFMEASLAEVRQELALLRASNSELEAYVRVWAGFAVALAARFGAVPLLLGYRWSQW